MAYYSQTPPVYYGTPGLFYGQPPLGPVPIKRNKMTLNVIALGFAKRTAEGIVSLALTIWDKTKTVADFAAANPTPANLKIKADAVTTHLGLISAKEAELEQLVEDLEPIVEELKLGLNQYANHAESKSKERGTLAGWGFPLRQERETVGQLPPPGDLQVSQGDVTASIEPHWDKVKGASSYIVEIAETSEGPWTQKYVGTKTSCVITGLVSGKEYWVRVCAVGAAGMSDWSDRASKRAT
jgi:hypothetical protein